MKMQMSGLTEIIHLICTLPSGASILSILCFLILSFLRVHYLWWLQWLTCYKGKGSAGWGQASCVHLEFSQDSLSGRL